MIRSPKELSGVMEMFCGLHLDMNLPKKKIELILNICECYCKEFIYQLKYMKKDEVILGKEMKRQ